MRPQTIQIFLPAGDPRGVRVAEITTRIVRVIEVPRSLLADFLDMPESQQPGLYYLVGGAGEGETAQLYIGQSGSVGGRLGQQNQSRDFWNRALVVVSLTNSITQTHVLFLEWLAIKEALAAERYALENGNNGARPHTPAPLEADCLEIHETARTLLATLGYPVFEPVARPSERDDNEILFCKSSGAQGSGVYTSEGFVVLKGSIGRLDSVPSIVGTAGGKLRQRLLDAGVMRAEGATVVFEKDHLFRSPSMAGLALMGRTCNGWLDWKDASGRTLNELKRQPSASS
ncbi:MAG: hypothetical protein RIR70_2071 [Pseudomonadota bacterium]|jgi:hypothetical protein